ncbi:MAG: S9 family peptidase [Candidatus Aminicenantes bacterium]
MQNSIHASGLFLKILLVFMVVGLFANEQATIPGPSFEEVISIRSVGAPVISPDGKNIAFTVRTTDWKDNRYDNEIWLIRDGKEPYQLTRTRDGSSSSPQWSPDGKWIAFLADRGDQQQIYLIRPDGGEAQKITDVKEGINSFEWSPDATQILFAKSEEQKNKEDREKRFGKFAVEDAEYQFIHLWIVDVKPDLWPSPEEVPCYESHTRSESDTEESAAQNTKDDCVSLPKPTQLTKGEAFTVNSYSFSPDGKKVAFSHQIDPLRNSYTTSDISILSLGTGKIQPLVSNPGYDGGPIWSPDSKWILYSTAAGNTTSDYYLNRQIHKIPAEGGESIRLAEDFDEDIRIVDWNSSGIYITAWRKTERHLFLLDPDSGKTELLAATPRNIWWASFSNDGKTVALYGQTPTTLTEIYKSHLPEYKPVALTNFSKQIKDWHVGSSEIISWKSKDGAVIEGVLHKPHNFEPQKKHPLFVIIHGGPTGIDYPAVETGNVYPVLQWMEKGALILMPNYRGSAGYGEKFRSLNVRNLGVGDMWDVMSGVDFLIEQGFVDPEKMGAMGWSQGGYISAFLATNTDRFKAISVGAGISNWTTYYVNTDIHPFTRQYLKATPWDDPEIYAKTSPITNIKRARTPTLIQHGEFDRRVPIPNAYELFQGLQDVGVETELIVYKGFGHGISKPKERLAAIWHNWQWFAKYIWNEDIALPLAREKGKKKK